MISFSAADFIQFLLNKFKDDPSKYYKELPSEIFDVSRSSSKLSLKNQHCRKPGMVSFFQMVQ